MSDKSHPFSKVNQADTEDQPLDRVSVRRELEIPDFDELVALAEQNPSELEQLKAKLSTQLIHNAPEYLQRRLKGIQFSLDLERQKTQSHYAYCMKISEMIQASLEDMNQALSNPQEYIRKHTQTKCEVIPLFPEEFTV